MCDAIFPDTEEGALACLRAQVDDFDFTDCSVFPDPAVYGVWKVVLPKMPHNMIVFMKGHPEPFGGIRQENECFDCDWGKNKVEKTTCSPNSLSFLFS